MLEKIHPDLRALALQIEELHEDPNNANVHSAASHEAITGSFLRFGQRKPIVVRKEGMIVEAGNGTLAALRAAGWTHLACVVCDDDAATATAYALVDNHKLSAWDMGQLSENVGELLAADYDLGGFGWSGDEILQLADRTWAQPIITVEDSGEPAGEAQDSETETAETEAPPETIPEPPAEPITQPGDLITMGDHRLICGSCRDPEVVARLLDGEKINVAFTSPPYASQRKYDETSGFKPIKPEDYVEWFEAVQANVREHLAEDGSWFVNIKSPVDGVGTHMYVLDLVIAHVRQWRWVWGTELCWERIGMPKSVAQRFKNQFEPVYQFAGGPWKMRPRAVMHKSDSVPVSVGAGGGNTNWSDGAGDCQQGSGSSIFGTGDSLPGMAYPGNRLPPFAPSRGVGHPAVFPIGLPTFFIKAYSDEGDVIYDPFEGSGTGIIAAEREKRRGYGCEISPKYCDVTVQRWENETGRKAKRPQR